MADNFLREDPWGRSLQPRKFNGWYTQNIQRGIKAFKIECGRVIDEVVGALHRNTPLDVKEVVKAGSLGKGTVLKESDFDCVVFVNPPDLPYLTDVGDVSSYVKGDLRSALRKIDTAISNSPHVLESEREELMVSAKLKVFGQQHEEVDVDILPTADNLHLVKTRKKKSKKRGLKIPSSVTSVASKGFNKTECTRVYESMISRSTAQDREPYSAGLVTLQIQFIRSKPTHVKELIRMVKYWNKVNVRSALDVTPLPTSYPMELITVYAWEKAGSPRKFVWLIGLKAVLTVIGNDLDTLQHFWETYYNNDIARRGINCMPARNRKSPLILDPANPTNNVCARFHDTWDDVAEIARKTLRSELLKNVEVTTCWQRM